MRAICQISQSQQLRFINRTYYSSTPSRLDTRLFNDLTFEDREYLPYWQKLEKTDDLFFQFRTSYSTFNINLVNKSTYAKTSLTATPIYNYELDDGTPIVVYNCDVTLTGLDGCYYVELELATGGLPEVTFWSEPFKVAEEWENTLLIKFGGNSTISDGFRWASTQYTIDRYQYLRIEARIIEGIPGTQKDTYDDSDIELTTLNANPIEIDTLDIKLIPYYLHEKINLALGHDEFWVNDLLYNIDEDFELTSFKQMLMRTGNIQLRRVDYENYNNYVDLEGTPLVLPTSYFLINDTDYMLINTTDKLQTNN